MSFDIREFTYEIICDEKVSDAVIETETDGESLKLYIKATKDKPKYIKLHWNKKPLSDELVLGDTWERSYGDLEFKKPSTKNKHMPWYFISTDKSCSFCFGVKTGCNSFISFTYDERGISALVDCRNGGNGVHLEGRKVLLATFIAKEYENADVLSCLKDYLKKLCDSPLLPKEIIYGGNNWYYAYGKSSYKEIISDAKLQAQLAEGIVNRPFEVIDDCWQKHKCAGPWLPNRKFKDMEKLAREIKEMGVRPGIWVRLLRNKDRHIRRDMKILRGKKRQYLDPTHPEAQEYIRADIERIKGWGFELMKHDFSSFDLFGDYGRDLNETVTKIDGWHFYDKTKTNAEIVLDFYRLIKDAAGDMLIIGCDTVSHLCAGLVHINRIGDDTSGREWDRTRRMGVNTLAFRLMQNEVFYMCDADCVGILKDYIPWEKNSQWLHLLSYSNTPLFVSCNNKITEKQKEDLKKAYKVFNERHDFKPVDIFETKTPSIWEIDGEEIRYNWD